MLPEGVLSFRLFPVCHPELFDAVLTGELGAVESMEVKRQGVATNWIWGAFKLPGRVYFAPERIWRERGSIDEYFGTLVNAYLEHGGKATASRGGEVYVHVGTVHGYREALQALEWARDGEYEHLTGAAARSECRTRDGVRLRKGAPQVRAEPIAWLKR